MERRWQVVILGGGFAGLACAKRLERHWGPEATGRVLLVSAENYFVFQPFLPEVIGASIEPRHVLNPIRFVLRHCSVQRAEVTAVDLEQRRVEFDAVEGPVPEAIEAEHLVLSLGSSTNLRAVPGMMEHGLFLKTLADALALREHIVKRLEEAAVTTDAAGRQALLHFVVVGGGYSGVETAGEVLDLLHAASAFYRLARSEVRVTLVHSGARVLPELDEALGRFAQRALEQRGMTVLLDRRVRSVSGDYVRLSDDVRLETHNVICTIGNAPHPVLSGLPAEYERGAVVTDEFLRVKGYSHVWAIGDCAANPDGYGRRCPPTAQFASPLGTRAADNVVASCRGGPLRPFRFKARGQMATIGRHRGVCAVLGMRFSGFFAWWLTRTVHLMKLPGLDRKLRVVADWTFELFFPPDLNYLDLKKTQKIARIHVEPGDVIFRQGERGKALYVVEEGALDATQRDADGSVLWQSDLVAGDHFGEGSLLYGLVRRATVVAKTPATLLMFGSADFKSFVEHFQALRQLLSETSLRVNPKGELGSAAWPDGLLASPVSAVMTAPAVCLPETATVEDGVRQLVEGERGLLPLVDADGKLSSVVTRTDLYRAVAQGRGLDDPLGSIASRDIIAFRSDQRIAEAIRVLYRNGLKHAPVLDQGARPVGILSYLDVAMAKMSDERLSPDKARKVSSGEHH